MSELKEYVKFSKKETSLLIKAIIIFSILYAIFASHISSYSLFEILIPICIWYSIYTYGQLWFHKFCAYKQAFTLEFKELTFNQFHLENHSSFTARHWLHHPIKYSIISITIAILTVGFVILPNIFTYTHKKIDHLFFGKRKLFEFKQGNLWPQENTLLRQSYAFFFTHLYPLVWIIILTPFKEIYLVQTLLIITIFHAFMNILPLLPHMGYRYFSIHFYLWSANFTMLLIFSLFSLFFTSFNAFLTISLCSSAIFLSIYFIRFTMEKK